MAKTTKIEWADSTWNPWRGCTRVSEGCKFCYAETMSKRNPSTLGIWGPNGTRVLASEATWREPLKWERLAAASGEPWRVFIASLADVFEDWPGQMTNAAGDHLWHDPPQPWPSPSGGKEIYTLAHARARLLRLCEDTPHLTKLLLTKRPENILAMTYDTWCKPVPGHVSQNESDGRRWAWPDNVWAMTSVENQETADRRIPELLKVPARIRGLSVEPLLGPVDLHFGQRDEGQLWERHLLIDWIIIGGESGPNARPCHIEWVRDLVKQCRAANIAVFVKQLGSRPVDDLCTLNKEPSIGAIRDHKGGNPKEWPEDLRVQEFPNY